MMKALVCGAGGFIGSHMVKRLVSEGYWVRGVDLKKPEFSETHAHEFVIGDLRDADFVSRCLEFKGEQGNFYYSIPDRYIQSFDEIYQFAADMGGAGFVFIGENDADIMHNSATINLNILNAQCKLNKKKNTGETKIFFSSSACIYPEYNQKDESSPKTAEHLAYPAQPDSEYGWEKLFSERLYLAFHRNYGIDVRIARYHNIFGPEGTWDGGREKAPAALCRKTAEAQDGGEIEIWGDGKQTRSFLYIDECIEGTLRLMKSEHTGPFNIGSEEMVSINQLAEIIMEIAGKNLQIKHIKGPLGVRGRNSNNRLIFEKLGWKPRQFLKEGLEKTYRWILEQVLKNKEFEVTGIPEYPDGYY